MNGLCNIRFKVFGVFILSVKGFPMKLRLTIHQSYHSGIVFYEWSMQYSNGIWIELDEYERYPI